MQQENKKAVSNPKPPEIKPKYKPIIGYRAFRIYERTGRIPKLEEVLDYDPLLEADVTMWIELMNYYRR